MLMPAWLCAAARLQVRRWRTPQTTPWGQALLLSARLPQPPPTAAPPPKRARPGARLTSAVCLQQGGRRSSSSRPLQAARPASPLAARLPEAVWAGSWQAGRRLLPPRGQPVAASAWRPLARALPLEAGLSLSRQRGARQRRRPSRRAAAGAAGSSLQARKRCPAAELGLAPVAAR